MSWLFCLASALPAMCLFLSNGSVPSQIYSLDIWSHDDNGREPLLLLLSLESVLYAV